MTFANTTMKTRVENRSIHFAKADEIFWISVLVSYEILSKVFNHFKMKGAQNVFEKSVFTYFCK